MSKIVFTGGHHNSALEVAKKLKKQGHQVHWIGHKFTMSGDKSLSAEYQEVTNQDIPFYELKTGKFYNVYNPLEYLKIALGFIQSLTYLLRIKPDLIVSFGGYLSVPVVITGAILKIPSVTHEQTVTAGWANKAISPFVKKIFLTHKEAIENYPSKKTVVTGLPLRPGILEDKEYQEPDPPLIFITCGKQGSHTINQALFPIIPQLVKDFQVVHQTGSSSVTKDKDKARRLKQSLPSNLRSRYQHKEYFFPAEATRYLKTSKLVVSRAGAHTIYELLYLNKPTVTIPIPWASHDEQAQNAQLLKQLGTAIILPQNKLTSKSLKQAINKGLKLEPKERKSPPVITDATEQVFQQLQPYLDEKKKE